MRRAPLFLLPLLAGVVMPAPGAIAGGGCHEPAAAGRGTTVKIHAVCFSPSILHVPTGATVKWVNSSGLAHNLSGSGRWYDDLADGTTVSRKFTAPGLYPYACTLHISMVGVVVVGGSTAAPPAGAALPQGTTVHTDADAAGTAAEAEQASAGTAVTPVGQDTAPDGGATTDTAASSPGGITGSPAAWLGAGLLVLLAAGLVLGSVRRRDATADAA